MLLFEFSTFQFKFLFLNYLRQPVYTMLDKFMMAAFGVFCLIFFYPVLGTKQLYFHHYILLHSDCMIQ